MGFFSTYDKMTPEKMIGIIGKHYQITERNGNVIEFDVQGMNLILVFDEHADRMRIICPICNRSDCEDDAIEKAMEANFHSALDARYGLSKGVVWSAFIHPMSSLTQELLISGIQQVAVAKATFGSEFTSGFLEFGG